MTMQEIYKIRPDIKEKVDQAYPVTKAEKKCRTKKNEMNGKREWMAKKLYEKPES